MTVLHTHQLVHALARLYKAPEYAFFTEVTDATGARQSQYCDGLAMALWPSRGLEVIGFEIKASRSDWLRERKNPAKAESIYQFCDRWFLVVGDPNIVADGELPATWGLMAPSTRADRKGKLTIVTPAPKLTPKPMSTEFVASILRRASAGMVPKASIDSQLEQRYQDGLERGKAQRGYANEDATRELEQLKREVEEFKAQSGIEISRYSGGELGAVVTALQKITRGPGAHVLVNRLMRGAADIRELADKLEKAGVDLNQVLDGGGA